MHAQSIALIFKSWFSAPSAYPPELPPRKDLGFSQASRIGGSSGAPPESAILDAANSPPVPQDSGIASIDAPPETAKTSSVAARAIPAEPSLLRSLYNRVSSLISSLGKLPAKIASVFKCFRSIFSRPGTTGRSPAQTGQTQDQAQARLQQVLAAESARIRERNLTQFPERLKRDVKAALSEVVVIEQLDALNIEQLEAPVICPQYVGREIKLYLEGDKEVYNKKDGNARPFLPSDTSLKEDEVIVPSVFIQDLKRFSTCTFNINGTQFDPAAAVVDASEVHSQQTARNKQIMDAVSELVQRSDPEKDEKLLGTALLLTTQIGRNCLVGVFKNSVTIFGVEELPSLRLQSMDPTIVTLSATQNQDGSIIPRAIKLEVEDNFKLETTSDEAIIKATMTTNISYILTQSGDDYVVSDLIFSFRVKVPNEDAPVLSGAMYPEFKFHDEDSTI